MSRFGTASGIFYAFFWLYVHCILQGIFVEVRSLHRQQLVLKLILFGFKCSKTRSDFDVFKFVFDTEVGGVFVLVKNAALISVNYKRVDIYLVLEM